MREQRGRQAVNWLSGHLVGWHLVRLVLQSTLAQGANVKDGPIAGIPFTLSSSLSTLPSQDADGSSAEMAVYRLGHGYGQVGSSSDAPAKLCDLGDQADPKKCLNLARGCMWTSVTTRDPFKRIQAVNSYCLPCEIDKQPIPCWNVGAWVGGQQVTECKMSCAHQQTILQPQYACSDSSGFISLSQCFDRAARSGSKCMYIEYEDAKGEPRASCGPCELQGSGGWSCPKNGGVGPVAGSRIKSCLSQCDVICAGPPACPPTVAPPPPPPLQQSPGLPEVAAPETAMLNAPMPWLAAPTINPQSIIESAREAALKLGWKILPPPPPPKVYWPVIYYRSPTDYLYTTGPPPPFDQPAPPLAQNTFLQTSRRKNLLRPQGQSRQHSLRHSS